MMYILGVVSLLISIHKIYSNSVTVHLDAKWKNTPMLAEASEYFSAESPELFWKYVQQLGLIRDKLALDQDDILNHALLTKIAKTLLNSGQISVLQLSLATRLYSAAVEMNHQLDTDLHCPHSAAIARIQDQSFCDLDSFISFISNNKVEVALNSPVLYKTDKIYPGIESFSSLIRGRIIVILYGDLQDIGFYKWHEAAIKMADKHDIYYVFRHRIKNRSEIKTRLSGYGVELAIKSTEYKAVDDTRPPTSGQDDPSEVKVDQPELKSNQEDEVQGFLFSKLKELHPNLTNSLDSFKQHLLKSDLSEIKPMKAWQIQELSLKAAQLVMNSLVNNEALESLRDISQNFPVRANHLSEVPVSQDLKNELLFNQGVFENNYGLQPGQSLVTFNGYALSQDLDIYEILDLARREMSIMTRLHDFGLQGDHISALMNVQYSSGDGASPQFLLDIRRAPVTYINNLEKDRRYNGWPTSVRDLLTPTYPGMMRRVAKNLFNTIVVLDPALPESRDFVKFVEAFIIHSAPIRMGFLWAVDPATELEKSPGRALIRAFNFVHGESDDPMSAVSFITDFYSSVDDNEVITVKMVKDFLKKKHPDFDMELTFGEKSDYDDNVKASWKYLHESGIIHLPKPFLLINGLLVDLKTLTESGFEEAVVTNVLSTTNELQKLVVEQKLIDGLPALDILLSGDNVVNRLNSKILHSNNGRYIGFTKSQKVSSKITKESIKSFGDDDLSTFIADNVKYFSKIDDSSCLKSTTIWVVADLDSLDGKALYHEAVKWVQSSINSRVALIQNPSVANKNSFLNRAVHLIIKTLPIEKARNTIISLLSVISTKDSREILANIAEEHDYLKTVLNEVVNVSPDYLMVEELFVKNSLKGEPGESFVITNGKVYSSFSSNETFIKDDYKLIERSCSGATHLLNKLTSILGGGAEKSKLLSDLTNKVHATLQKDLAKSSTSAQVGIMSTSKKVEIKGLREEYSGFTLMGHISKPAFDLIAIIDPLSRTAQKLSHIMIVLREALNLNVRVIFNCKDKLSEQPLKSFYRFVLDASPIVKDIDGNPTAMSNPKAQFTRLPGQPLLTLGLEPIHNWLVEATKSVYDLDNIRLSEVKNGMVYAYFELEYLLLEGHCVDLTTGQPPRGLQFVLTGNDAKRTTHDTIVMANLGYFQLKANPGAWNVALREGKSKNIYDIIDHEFTDSEEKSTEVVAVLNSFRAKIIRVKVNKKADKVNENVLSESKLDEETGSIWKSISNAFTNKKSETKNETINIFSVASGHLYERFLRIMMLSVMKHTKSKVKFWFLKNFLSPTFKQFIPHMAKKYGFEYDLVQYKWPRWLHQQTEKQRIIWGYKILFLDVLFPLNVSKIIFVDADQTVRADLQELVDLDLEGAPYGYTPFCSSRTEMDGFRFWKSGYWAQHLAGRPYHISALYVVDLARFRVMAAGDRLRGQYHGLSQDPASLANLDQDLPNNMVHQVPIKSLPQDWLWCETWCAEGAKAAAKTIDLCNNPLTKEPKLAAAARIVPEWRAYDDEVRLLWDSVHGDQTLKRTVPTGGHGDGDDVIPPQPTTGKVEL